MQVRSWIRGTTAARMQLDHLNELRLSGDPRDLLIELDALKEALESNGVAGTKVLAGLSVPQRSELKKNVKKLEEAKRALAGAFVDLNLNSAGAPNRAQILKGIQKARKAIMIEQQEQQKLADEMGVTV